MKTKKAISLIPVLLAVLQIAVAQSPSAKSYQTGNYIFCGKELPKNFSWLIEKQDATGAWIPIAELQAPKSAAECRIRSMSLPKAVSSTGLSQDAGDYVWERIKNPSSSLDSLYAHSANPGYQYIAGAGWFDEGIKAPGTYRYRVSKLNRSGSKTAAGDASVNFPPVPFAGEAVPVRYKVNMGYIEISYELSDMQNTAGLKLQRSPYMQDMFRETPVEIMFAPEKGKMVALVRDKDVTTGLTYSYRAVPFDGLGNPGKPAETVSVYFVTKPADIGLVTWFTVTPQPDKGGNLLKWDYNHSAFVNAIEIYRSRSYNDNYKRVVSLPAGQSEYFDDSNLEPSVTHYYYVVINNGLGNSLPSARVPAILQGKRENIIPPQDLSVSRTGNVVTLKFRRVGYDIHGYYVYRANGYESELRQLPRMLLASDSLVTYTDTLAVNIRSSVYSYAVASVNTSYNISPLSNRVSTSYSGGLMPVPDNLNTIFDNDAVTLVWNNVADLNPSIASYEVYRKAIYEGKVTETEKLVGTVNFMTNSFTDKMIVTGRNYVYRVRCIASDTSDAGSFSLPYSLHVPANKALPPGEVSAIASSKSIILKWTMPVVNDIESVLIYRAEQNGKENLLKTLGPDSESYEDSSARKGVMYYYFIVIKYKNGAESKPGDAVSAKISVERM